MDISLNSNQVVPTGSTVTARGIVGGTTTINAGRAVYADPTTNQILLAQANSSAQLASAIGVALTTSAPNQPIVYATAGDIAFSNGPFTTVTTYVLSAANPGGIAPTSDLVTGNYGTVLGIATTSSNLRLDIVASSAQK